MTPPVSTSGGKLARNLLGEGGCGAMPGRVVGHAVDPAWPDAGDAGHGQHRPAPAAEQGLRRHRRPQGSQHRREVPATPPRRAVSESRIRTCPTMRRATDEHEPARERLRRPLLRRRQPGETRSGSSHGERMGSAAPGTPPGPRSARAPMRYLWRPERATREWITETTWDLIPSTRS